MRAPAEAAEGIRVALRTGSESSYEVLVAAGLWDRLPELVREHCAARRYAMITDERVEGLHAAAITQRLADAGLRVDVFAFPPGEANKNREHWSVLTDRMLAAGLGRDAAVLAFGGGVVGDLAGFVAATYLRGVPFVQIPTTLLAMVDSSVGGKTGVDTPAGKNLVGAFHPPRLVVADVAALATLPAAELRAGLAEAVKHAAITDAAYLGWIEAHHPEILEADPVACARLVRRSVEIKAEVVALDEREAGPRKTLNFGHTIGHALEAVSDYRLLHGDAVAIGMVAEARLGEALGVTAAGTAETIRAVLARVGLPVEVPEGIAPARIVGLTRADKKVRDDRVEYALIAEVGEAVGASGSGWSIPVDDARVMAVLTG